MKYIKNTIEYPVYTSRMYDMYFGGMNAGVLDIETTGLSPKNSAFVLGGLLTAEAAGLVSEQFFADTLDEEQAALSQFWKASAAKDLLITFNGQSFDLPFIRERAPHTVTDMPYNLDLFQLVRKYSPIRQFLPNLKQKSIENYMGLWQYRKDEISGKESVDLYYRYLSSQDDKLREVILLHNHDDIVQLYRLLKVIEKTDFHRAMFDMGFPVKDSDDHSAVIEKIGIRQDWITISGRQHGRAFSCQAYDYNGTICRIDFSAQTGRFSIALPVISQNGLIAVDLEALGGGFSQLEKYPACQEGFLILKNGDTTNYMETNHFIKIFTERIIREWITNR